jgi:hypothetical protein
MQMTAGRHTMPSSIPLGPFQYPEAPKVWPRPRLLASAATPARFIDFSIAPDAETAEKQVAEAHDISDSPRFD